MTLTELDAAPDVFRDKIDAADRQALGLKTKAQRIEKIERTSERELQDQIAGLLRVKGIAFAQQRMDRKSNVAKGWPDFVFAHYARPIAFEVKTGRNQQTEEQYQTQNTMELNGWSYHVIRELDQVLTILKAIEASR